MPPKSHRDSQPQTGDNRRSRRHDKGIFVDGRRYSVQRRERIRGRCYLLLEQLAPPPRERWLAFDSAAGGRPRVMLFLPSDAATRQHVRVLRNLETGALPRISDFDFGKTQTRVVVPWVKGIDAAEYLTRIQKKKVDPPEPFHVVRLMLELARALRHLHRYAQVIHGDIKPANLILTRKSSHLHLIDFGSAWPMGMTGVRVDAEGLSGAFAAPELTAGGIINDRADQFSASVVFYQLLTGKIPYEELGGKAGWPQWRREANVAIPPSQIPLSPKYLPRKLWHEINALVLMGIELDPSRRYPHSSTWVDQMESLFLKLRIRRDANGRPTAIWDRFCDWLAGRWDGKTPEGVC